MKKNSLKKIVLRKFYYLLDLVFIYINKRKFNKIKKGRKMI